jgi:predicted metal-binding protein
MFMRTALSLTVSLKNIVVANRHGLDCTVGCRECKGDTGSCSNSNLKNITDTDMTEDISTTYQ